MLYLQAYIHESPKIRDVMSTYKFHSTEIRPQYFPELG